MSIQNKLLNVLFYVTTLLFLSLSSIVFVFYHFGRFLPSELTLLDYRPPASSRLFSSDGQLMEEYASERRIIVSFDKIPRIIKAAFLIAEDKEFYKHSGISFQSLSRAIIENTSKKTWSSRPAGGSTITQQVAKNLLVGNQRSFSRKIKEAIMAFRIESSISKDKILEIYLNHLYLGKGCYGIVEASNFYFGKKLTKLSPEEASFLAALPSAPSIYVNLKDSEKLLIKRNAILSQLQEFGFINKKELLASIVKPLNVKEQKTKLPVPYFSEEIHRIVTKYVPEEVFFKGGYSIVTTMNQKLQKMAQKALEDGIIEYTKKQSWEGPLKEEDLGVIEKQLPRTVNKIKAVKVNWNREGKISAVDKEGKLISFQTEKNLRKGDRVLVRFNEDSSSYELYQQPKITGGIVVMDASSGDVLALSGGYSFDLSSFNCATQAKRQPGSTIKPFIYAAALEAGFKEDDVIEDKPITLQIGPGKFYTPHNYNKKSNGKVQLRNGLIFSYNLATLNLARKLGFEPIKTLLRDVELIDQDFNISYVLGSKETTLLNLVAAFSIFINEGDMVKPRLIKKVSKSDSVVCSFEKELCKKKEKKGVISRETALKVKNMLRDAAKFGTAKQLAGLFNEGVEDLGGKTGTTNSFKDAWFVGYFTKKKRTFLVGIFTGYQNSNSLGEDFSGSKVALPIFFHFAKDCFTKLTNF